jgi:hypothetical protein
MASTYSNSGIELIANGEQSGTWGDTTNVNLQIIDRLTNGVGSISLSGTTHTLTTSDGSLSAGQYRVLVFGGSPSGTNTVTISPNDATHLYFVRNASGQSVVLTQGSGGNVTIANGDTKVVYTDGAGAGAEVVDITDDFAMGSVNITGGTISGITDLAVADGGTGASDAATARTNLGLAIGTDVQAYDADLTTLGELSKTVGNFIVGGGSTWLVESGSTARTSLGLGSIATQNSDSVSITGGDISGITDLAIADGGTGSSTAAGALSNFGLTATAAELNYTDGVTSNIQTQLDAKLSSTNPTITGTAIEDIYALSGTTPALEPDNGSIQTWTLTGNSTPTDGFSAGQAVTLMINDGTAYTITWPTMTWVNNGGTAPTLATSGYTVIALWKVSTTLYGALVGDGS